MKDTDKIRFQVVNKRRFAWSLVVASLFLLVVSVLASWFYYQSLLREKKTFIPADNKTIEVLQNATDNFTIRR